MRHTDTGNMKPCMYQYTGVRVPGTTAQRDSFVPKEALPTGCYLRGPRYSSSGFYYDLLPVLASTSPVSPTGTGERYEASRIFETVLSVEDHARGTRSSSTGSTWILLRITHDTDSARAARARGHMDFSISRYYSGRKIRLKSKLDLCERPVQLGIKD